MVKHFESFVAFGDAHGDLHCREAVKALEKHISILKPDHVVCLGDMFDFRALRAGMRSDESDCYDDLISS